MEVGQETPPVDWSKIFTICLLVLSLTLFYAILRYNIVREIPLANLPIYITNKSVSLSATILIGISFLLGPLARLAPSTFSQSVSIRKHIGIAGFWLATVHAIMSLAILNSAYYPRLFQESGKLTGIGESMLLVGILALVIFGTISVVSIPSVSSTMQGSAWQAVQRLGYLAYFFILIHVFVIGYRGWMQPDSWRFGLISISLIAALFIVLVFIIRLIVAALPPRQPQG